MFELETLYKNTLEVSKTLQLQSAIAGEKNSGELANLNVSQMNKGIDGFGNRITPKYTPPYANIKGFSTPNLKVEGIYHKSIFVEEKGGRELYGSKDEGSDKVNFLEDHYDNNQYGINPNNEQKAADIKEPDLFESVEKTLEKGIL